jgi:hypothetical protein
VLFDKCQTALLHLICPGLPAPTRFRDFWRRKVRPATQIDGLGARPTIRGLPCPLQRGQRTSRNTTRTDASGSRGFIRKSRSVTPPQLSQSICIQWCFARSAVAIVGQNPAELWADRRALKCRTMSNASCSPSRVRRIRSTSSTISWCRGRLYCSGMTAWASWTRSLPVTAITTSILTVQVVFIDLDSSPVLFRQGRGLVDHAQSGDHSNPKSAPNFCRAVFRVSKREKGGMRGPTP